MQLNSNFTGNVNLSKSKKDKNEVDAIPTSIADLTKDEDKNGIPDFADNIIKNSKQQNSNQIFSKTYININGKTFDNMADATKYATENIPALKLINKMFNTNQFFNTGVKDIVIDGEIVDNNTKINKTFDANQQINTNSKNLAKGANKTDLVLGLVIVALIFIIILNFVFK